NRQTFRSGQRVCDPSQTLDRRALHRLAQSLPKARQGLGEPQPQGARVLTPRLNPPHAQKTLQSGLNSPDRLLESATSLVPSGLIAIALTRAPVSPRRMSSVPSARLQTRTVRS